MSDGFNEKNPPVVRTTETVPVDPKKLDRAIRKQRQMLEKLKEEPEKCRLLKKERENWDVGKKLDATRVATRERLAICSQKAEAFDKRQLELKNVVLSNEGFIKDTDIKIERAERKARDEQLAWKRADEELLQVAHLYKAKVEEREQEIKDIRHQMSFQNFLEKAGNYYSSLKETAFKADAVETHKKNTKPAGLLMDRGGGPPSPASATGAASVTNASSAASAGGKDQTFLTQQ